MVIPGVRRIRAGDAGFGLGVFHRKVHLVDVKEALGWSVFWIALFFLEVTDVIFAVDSVPAIFAITDEPFIVVISNNFALLGLRSLYFVLSGALHRFTLIKYGLALVLVFVGLKMAWLNELMGGKFPISWSLLIIGMLIGGSIAAPLSSRI